MKQFQSTIKLKSLKNYGPSPLARQPSILFIFNGFARNWARVLDIAGYKFGYSAHHAYFQRLADRWALAVANKLYIVSVVYA
jgi:hypothetical protein